MPLSCSGVLEQLSKPWLHQFHPHRTGSLLELLQGLRCVQSGKFLQWLSRDAHQVCPLLRCIHLKERPIRMISCLPQVSAAWARDTHTHTMPLWPRWFPLLGMSASMESQRLLCPRLLQQFRYFCLTGEELRLLKRQEKRDGQRGSPRARVCTQASGSHSRLFSLPHLFQESMPFSCPS